MSHRPLEQASALYPGSVDNDVDLPGKPAWIAAGLQIRIAQHIYVVVVPFASHPLGVDCQPAARGEIYETMQAIMEDSGSFAFVSNEMTGLLYRDTLIPGILPDGRPVFHAFRFAD